MLPSPWSWGEFAAPAHWNGTAELRFLDPETFAERRRVTVTHDGYAYVSYWDDGAVILRLVSGSIAMDASVVDPESRSVSTMQMEASWDGLCGRAVVVIDGSGADEASDCVPTDVLPAGFDDIFVVVGEVQGDWYVSYIETALAYIELFLEAELAN